MVRRIGDLTVSPIGFGVMGLVPGFYGEVTPDEAAAAVRHALDQGVTFLDTADSYGPDGAGERLVGQVLAEAPRPGVKVATKFGLAVPRGADRRFIEVGYGFSTLAVNAEPALVQRYVDASRERLGVEVIDLLYLHFPDPGVPLEATVAAMGELVGAGAVGQIGLSNVTAAQLAAAHAVHPIAAVQVEWSVWQPIDPALRSCCQAIGAAVVPWGPLGAGFLAGPVGPLSDRDFRRWIPRLDAVNRPENERRYAPFVAVADGLGITRSQLALAWLLHHGDDVIPIPCSRNPAHIDENIAAADIVLPTDVLAQVDEFAANFQPVGPSLLETS